MRFENVVRKLKYSELMLEGSSSDISFVKY